MATVKELTAKIKILEDQMAQLGFRQPLATPSTPEERADYIAHGSPEHAAFLGLVEVGKDDKTITLATFTSPRTGKTYRLEAELDGVKHFPGMEAEKAAALLLQQKVGELDTNPSPLPGAPEPFDPALVYP